MIKVPKAAKETSVVRHEGVSKETISVSQEKNVGTLKTTLR